MSTSSGNVLAFRPVLRVPAAEPARTPDVLLGPSPAMTRLWSQMRRVAPYFRTALITGERGVGHEAVAHALHSLSPRATRPFVTIAADDAAPILAGTATRWSGDTLFFPDIHRLSAQAQQALVRITRLRRPHQVAIIAASTGDLRPLVSAGSFCSVLAAALSALQITVPALRERPEDIPALATHLLAHEARSLDLIPPAPGTAMLDVLSTFPWPGNLDQLRGTLERLLQSTEPDDVAELRPFLESLTHEPEQPTASTQEAPDPVRMIKLEDVLQQHIRAVLVACNGNKLRASEVLGISRSTLYRMLDSGTPNQTLPFAV